MVVNIVDYIGVHCGMHYYNESLKRCLDSIDKVDVVRVLSNYNESYASPFFVNIYNKYRVLSAVFLIYNYLKLLFKVLLNRNECYIFLSYGNYIDIPFFFIIACANKSIVDVHEVVNQANDSSRFMNHVFKFLYSNVINAVIYHSDSIRDFLDKYDYSKIRLFVPHFKYMFSKYINEDQLGSEVKNSISKSKINILFFGNITFSKGVDILLDSIDKMSNDQRAILNIIIAGKLMDNPIVISKSNKKCLTVILRHINDDELIYLYQNIDYIILPYRKTSQSGILEMAFYFRKPVVVSNIDYFVKKLNEFPSFGILTKPSIDDLFNTLSCVINMHGKTQYYSKDDCEKYENKKDINYFQLMFNNWLCSS